MTVTSAGGPNFTLSASPASLSVEQGDQGTSTITATVSGGFNNFITLSASGVPLGVSVSFDPQTIPAPGSGTSVMTMTVLRFAPLGTYPITVTGKGGGIQQNTTVTLTIIGPQDFELSASPASLSIAQRSQGTVTVTSTVSGGFDNSVNLSASGVPAGTTVTFDPATIPAPGSGASTMTLTVSLSTYPGMYPITITGNGGGLQRIATIQLTVLAGPSFAIGASPAYLNVPQGNQGTSTITTFACCGFNSAITLSASGAPSGTNVSFNPSTISAPGSGNSTMTMTVAGNTPTGTYPITVTGTGGGLQPTTTVTLNVTGGASPGNANFMEPYSYTLQSSFGQAPYSYQLVSGSLPAGLGMNASGTIAGTATAVGAFPFQVLVTDSAHHQQTSNYTLNVVIGMDQYGGLTAAPLPGCTPTGYFQLLKVKIGSNPARWVYADPLCNAFYQLSVYDADPSFILGAIYQSRYGGDSVKWAKHSLQRELAYSFNANDVFYSDYMLPIPKGGNGKGASIQLPFLLFYDTTDDAIYNPEGVGIPESVKNLCARTGQLRLWALQLHPGRAGSQLDGGQPGRAGVAAQPRR